jgi:hypothetical protein
MVSRISRTNHAGLAQNSTSGFRNPKIKASKQVNQESQDQVLEDLVHISIGRLQNFKIQPLRIMSPLVQKRIKVSQNQVMEDLVTFPFPFLSRTFCPKDQVY